MFSLFGTTVPNTKSGAKYKVLYSKHLSGVWQFGTPIHTMVPNTPYTPPDTMESVSCVGSYAPPTGYATQHSLTLVCN